MKPFYLWFAAVTLFLVAAVTPLPFELPVPWTGIVLAILVLSVSALPFVYGRVYIVSDLLRVSREPSIDGDDSGALLRGVGDDGEGTAGRFRLDEGDVFGRESYPLLGSTEGVGSIGSRNLTWKQCLQVYFTLGLEQYCCCTLRCIRACSPLSSSLIIPCAPSCTRSSSPGRAVLGAVLELPLQRRIRVGRYQQHSVLGPIVGHGLERLAGEKNEPHPDLRWSTKRRRGAMIQRSA